MIHQAIVAAGKACFRTSCHKRSEAIAPAHFRAPALFISRTTLDHNRHSAGLNHQDHCPPREAEAVKSPGELRDRRISQDFNETAESLRAGNSASRNAEEKDLGRNKAPIRSRMKAKERVHCFTSPHQANRHIRRTALSNTKSCLLLCSISQSITPNQSRSQG